MDPTEFASIGRSGVRVTRLGLGMASFGYAARTTDEDAVAVVGALGALGLHYVDVAPEYGLGLAEQRLGRALAAGAGEGAILSTKVGRLIRPATRRYRISHAIVEAMSSRAGAEVLAGKTIRISKRLLGAASRSRRADPHAGGLASAPGVRGAGLGEIPAAVCDYSYDGVMRSFEQSLGRLGVERVDIAFIHEPDLHHRQAARSAYRALERLRAEGSIDALGVAMNDPAALVRFADEGEYDCFLIGGRYTLLQQGAIARLLPLAQQRGIPIILGGPFNSGIMANPVPGARFDHAPAPPRLIEKARRIAAVCERHGVPVKAAALQFPFGHPAIASVLVGATSIAAITEDVELMRRPIPPALWDDLRRERLLDPRAPTPG